MLELRLGVPSRLMARGVLKLLYGDVGGIMPPAPRILKDRKGDSSLDPGFDGEDEGGVGLGFDGVDSG